MDYVHVCSDPVVVPVESEEDKAEHSDAEKEDDVGITFVARKAETPKQRPKSGANTTEKLSYEIQLHHNKCFS